MNPERLPVPDDVAERARQVAAGRLRPVPARPASTVVLLRDTTFGLQVYVLRRRNTMAFAAGMYAFPGGGVDPRDRDADVVDAGESPDGGRRFAAGSTANGPGSEWTCAAARELFEETGVLLAGPDHQTLVADTTGTDFEADRVALVGKELAFSDFLARRGLVLRADLLTPYAHWVTPEAEPRRYDTRFYLAALPEGQRTRDVSGEADRVAWLRPVDVEAAVHAGEMRMLPPTAATIGSLVSTRTSAEAVTAARSREVVRIQPSVVFDDPDGPARWSLA